MREEEGSRYLSSLVKQDLAKLDTDGDTRRLAVQSLKLFVENLDSSTLPRFISQIAESREPGATRSYAISLYEEVARVHGKLVVPHIPKVMGSLVRSSSASGSFPQLQVACARVTAAVARFGIDSNTSQEDAEEIIREICTPLIDALSGKLEPVAATAAACIHALAETERWKYAPEDIIDEVCQRTTVALSEKSTRTSAHVQLIRILTSVNPDILSLHGVSLLKAGEEILKVTANPWQLRKAAAQLLQSVLTILDKETLETELNPALHALESCRLDRMPHVRAAVSDALHTAKMLTSGTATHTSFGMAASPIRKSAERNDRSPWSHEDLVPVSPVLKRGQSLRAPVSPRTSSSLRVASTSPRTSQESRRLSFSPASMSTSGSAQVPSPARNKGEKMAKRAPLYPGRGIGYVHSSQSSGTPGTSPSSSTTTVEECESPSRRLNIKEFNVRFRRAGMNGVYPEADEARHGDNHLRPLPPLTSGAFTPLLPIQLDTLGVEGQKLKEAQASKDVGTDVPPPELIREIVKDTTKTILAGEDSRSLQIVDGLEDDPQARSKSSRCVEVALPRLKVGGISSLGQQSGLKYTSDDSLPILKASTISLQSGLANDFKVARSEREEGGESANADVEVEKHEIFLPNTPASAQYSAIGVEINTEKSKEGGSTHGQPRSLKHHYNALAHLDVNLDEEKTQTSPSMAKDFLPYLTPKRLVRSLSSLSILDSRGSMLEQDMKLSQDDVLLGMQSNKGDAAELDAETSSEAGWSVRDNPIASEESYGAGGSDEEMDEGRRGSRVSFPRVREVGSADSCSPREIHMIVPASKIVRSVDDGATLDPVGLANNPHQASSSEEGSDEDQICPSCALAEQSFTSCRIRTPSQAVKEMEGGKPSGLSSLLHRDEINQKSDLCSTCAWQGREQNQSTLEESDFNGQPSKKIPKRSDQGLMRMVTQNWKRLCWCTEAVLGGSLCLVIALPLAMIVAKAVNESRDCHLVPT